MMRLRRCLGDLVPVVLDRTVPEPADQCLVRGGRDAVGDSQRFHFVEDGSVLSAGQRRWRPGPELARALQDEGFDLGPMREYRLLGKIGRGGLVVTRCGAEYVRDRHCGRTVIAAHDQGRLGDCLPNISSEGLVLSVRDSRQRLLELRVEHRLKCRVQGKQYFMSGRRGSCLL